MVEDSAAVSWTRSSFCDVTNCVEVAVSSGGIGVRDGKCADSPVLSFTRDEWNAFVLGVKSGEFDLV